MQVDLHIHTTCSDGIYTPQEIVEQAAAAGLSCISVTDHDTVNGYLQARDALNNSGNMLRLVPGIEIDTATREDYTIHVLGYHYDVANQELHDAMEWMREGRKQRIRRMTEKVAALTGCVITYEMVLAMAANSKSVGRPHIARVLMSMGICDSVEDAFAKYLAKGKPAYCRQEKLTPSEAVLLLHNAGGMAVLAHPSELNNDAAILSLLDTANFDGLEVWHPSAEAMNKFAFWEEAADQRRLLKSGGSDFHGDGSRPPKSLGIFVVSYENVKYVIKYKDK